MMELRYYEDINSFLADTRAELLAHETENTLIMSILLHIQKDPSYYKEKYLAAVFEDKKVSAIAVCTPPFKILLYSNIITPSEQIRLIAEDVQKRITIPGILAASEHSLLFAEIWQNLTGISFKLGMSERIYKLEKVTFPRKVSGEMRIATLADLELICKWMLEFHDEAIPNDPLTEFSDFATKKIENSDIFFWEDNEIVSMVSKARPNINGISVNLVYTPANFRRKGYASALVAQLSQKLLDAGWKYITLFTDLSNPTSNSIYQKIGYRPFCDFQEYNFV
ncbi:MAG: GNAT family N-acetyltransferase [Candidatus Cloacimonadales bacterium]|nr:GNAT family N-acetyltransferase [Candidatus Cloacimonadales bacterium]